MLGLEFQPGEVGAEAGVAVLKALYARSAEGPVTPEERAAVMKDSLVAGVYEKTVDRESAYELLSARAAQAGVEAAEQQPSKAKRMQMQGWEKGGETRLAYSYCVF